ncbi:Carboxymuconolactone decarboxylase [Penicillium expansum]|uniref:Carboxymuconolactone decarboxylase n=1 Tax=Penicillium expansum TaxID=27334 RepID=A0A0A2J3V8_PENEN|nr:Carboxymuconolactone decarboxylase [Penicillium expansum]KAJ5488209.1 Carboxymuconolactone decarboxylase [Penicillium expansum]KGO39454.1 Carboxymuconolactone decarboxylase [Penicillium expansum]KGO50057.1 Carboxymuconolactone decarboxylase [Penicillium expansum]KGO55814.1 Carboxymuconolactone decarboxylase [Penicillium expansum]
MAQNPSEKLLLGAQMSKEFLGEDLLSNLRNNARDDIFTKASQEYIAEVCFSSYARPGLKFRERSLMNIAMLTALNRGPELRIHITAGLHNGLTEEEICEACRHAMVYCGVPAGRDALAIASEVVNSQKDRSDV